jgi:hypothetical protein
MGNQNRCHCETNLNDLAEYGTEDLEIEWEVSGRGFMVGEFRDLYGQECSIQESSSAEYYAIWLGVGGCRMHLTNAQARDLARVLRVFVKDRGLGAFAPPAPPAAREGER